MKTLLKFLAMLLLLAMPVTATTVSGHLFTPAGAAPANGSVCFTLQNYQPNVPKVSGTAIIGAQTNFCVSVNTSTGVFSTSLYGNDVIEAGGVTGNTRWRIDFIVNGRQQSSAVYNITGTTYNIDSATPVSTLPAATSSSVSTQVYVHTQASAATTWTVNHGFGDPNTVCTFFDNASPNQQLFPDTVKLTDSNNVTATFSVAQAGRAICIRASSFTFSTQTINDVVVKTSTGNQLITGNNYLGTDGHFRWKSGTSFFGIVTHANTADRTYTFPDVTTTLGGLGVTQTWTGVNTFTGAATFNGVLTLGSTVTGNIVPTTSGYSLGNGSGNNFSSGYFDSFLVVSPASGSPSTLGAIRMNKNGSIYMKTELSADMPIVTKDINDIITIGGSVGVNFPTGIFHTIITLPTGATPSVAGGAVFNTSNTGATSITNLTGAFSGQVVTIICTETNTTFVDGASLALAGNLVCTVDDIIKLVYNGTKWIEISRSVN